MGGEVSAVRRLSQPDYPLLEALCAEEPGYTLFLGSNLPYLSSHTGLVRYWGVFADHALVSVLMMVGRRAIIFAQQSSNSAPLAQIAVQQHVDFMMGQPTSVSTLLRSRALEWLERREEHYLAAYPLDKTLPPINSPQGTVIRRAQLQDLEALTTLYYRTDGFEALNKDQLRRVLHGRIRSFRTWIVQYQDAILSAASTSAETAAAAMVGGVWTAPSWRGRSLSSAVMTAMTRELMTEGRRPYLFYLTHNRAAAHVYTRVGYQTIGGWSAAYLKPPETIDTSAES